MTREEAIEVIEQDIPCEHDKDLIEALEMAISALSAEGEYIKKDDAISKILTEFVSREENGKVMCACADVKQTCADILDSLPTYSFPDSAENKGEWIPVSERLPKPYEQVLRTIKSIGWNGTSHSYVDLGSICPIDTDVVAWQPLPDPYKKGE